MYIIVRKHSDGSLSTCSGNLKSCNDVNVATETAERLARQYTRSQFIVMKAITISSVHETPVNTVSFQE